ncbi:ribosome-associated protein [Natronospira proteinivora]|uniref:Ribosomal silencing factor RsfS n=1 Tax=Natronospira proteinivora TaxID=1807133 RepID=A0ABT1G8S2_9GAMM|nr:ribosome silencing factor [Natronospira proteinivora]MCP1727695.1 ribosome-associated protein [Natronospira proteinivora]
MQGEALNHWIVDKLDDMKARDITVLDVRSVTPIFDTVIIASGTSSRHVSSVAEYLVQAVKKAGLQPAGVEGSSDSDWVLVDMGEAVVHVMHPDSRAFYNLEKLWSLDDQDESGRENRARVAAGGRPPSMSGD